MICFRSFAVLFLFLSAASVAHGATIAGDNAGAWADVQYRGQTGCALHADGRVGCWGSNYENALGAPATDSVFADGPLGRPGRDSLRFIPGVVGATVLSVGERGACVVASGKAVCWGEGRDGLADFGPAIDVATARETTCVVTPTGLPKCALARSNKLVVVPEITDAVEVAVRYSLPCFVRSSGAVTCVRVKSKPLLKVTKSKTPPGERVQQELKRKNAYCHVDGKARSHCNTSAEKPSMLTAYTLSNFRCTVEADGTAGCEYEGTYPVPGIDDAVAVVARNYDICLLRKNGRIGCFTVGMVLKPVFSEPMAAPVSGITGLKASRSAFCALDNAGAPVCWGLMRVGERVADNQTALTVELPARAIRIGMNFAGACATTEEGESWCWGGGYWGRTPPSAEDAKVRLRSWGSAATATDPTCAALRDGRLVCETDRRFYAPRPGPMLGRVTDIAAGAGTTCAVSRKQLHCWGGNGAQSYGSEVTRLRTPWSVKTVQVSNVGIVCASNGRGSVACTKKAGDRRLVSMLSRVAPWALGRYGVCGVKNAEVKCKQFFKHLRPPPFARLKGIRDLKVGAGTMCAVTGDGIFHCVDLRTIGDSIGKKRGPRERLSWSKYGYDGLSFQTVRTDATVLHTLDNEGVLYALGTNSPPKYYGRSPPRAVADAPRFKALLDTRHRLCGVTTDDKVTCEGSHDRGWSTLREPVADFAMSEFGGCFLDAAGKLTCWNEGLPEAHGPRSGPESRHEVVVDNENATAK